MDPIHKRPIEKVVRRAKEGIKRTRERIVAYSLKHSLGLGFWIFTLVVFILGTIFFSNIQYFVKNMVSIYGYVGIFVMSFITDVLVQPVGPDIPLIAGILGRLNPWTVLAMVLLGSYLAILATYFIGKKVGAPGIERIIGKRSFEKISKYEFEGKWFLFIGALTPVPYIPYLAGLWKLSFKDVMIYVVFPRTLRFIIVFVATYYLGIVLFD